MTEAPRPVWDHKQMSEADFRNVYQMGRIVSVDARWEYTSADTTREWLEVETSDGGTFVLPHTWSVALKFVGHSSVPGLFALTYDGEKMRDTVQAIDAWEAKNAKDREEYERLKRKFGDTP